MRKRLLFTLLALILAGQVAFSQDALQEYQSAYAEACQWTEAWQSDQEIFTALRAKYTTLSKACETYAPENVDASDESALKTATTKLNSAVSGFKTVAESSKNTQKAVTKTTFDPNFHIYLCFGQSNMEGNATPELIDYSGSSTRFLTMAAVNMSTHSRTKGKWYVARPPLCRDWTGLTPADYFGKTLIKQLPDSISVGVINVALGGCAIEMFMYQGTELKNYLTKQADWLQGYARDYNNEPYDQLIALAKQAQKVGVIRGVLLHQGCSNNTQQDWPNKVNVIYQRMLKDLNLKQDEVPLLIGELLSQAKGGVCWGHNSVIAKCPSIISNSHVVSSKDCPGASDGLHFTAEGYRMIGANYANVMRPLLARVVKENDYTIKSLVAKEKRIVMPVASSQPLYITLTDEAGAKHDVTIACDYTCSNPNLVSFSSTNVVSGNQEGEGTVTATFTNKEGQTVSVEFEIEVRLFPLAAGAFNPSVKKNGTFTAMSSYSKFVSEKGGMGGWQFSQGLDLSAYRSLVVQLRTVTQAKPSVRIYDVDDTDSEEYYSLSMAGTKEVVVDLQNMTTASGRKIDPSHIYFVGLTAESSSNILISNFYVSMDDPTSLDLIESDAVKVKDGAWFDLAGRRVAVPQKGVYVKDGKKVMY